MTSDLRGLLAGDVGALLFLVLPGSLRDVGVVDQSAEEAGDLRTYVQLFL